MANYGFRYFDANIAEAITMMGQVSIKHTNGYVNEFLNKILKTNKDYCITIDTDSGYFDFQPIVDVLDVVDIDKTVSAISKFCESKIQPVIQSAIDDMYEQCNCSNKVMAMKREAIASSSVFCKKKRYAMMVHNSEGVDYKPYKLKIMGMDIVKSSTPMVVRDMLKDSLLTIFTSDNDELIKNINKHHKDFGTLSLDDIAFPRGISDLDKYATGDTYSKGCPIHVRAGILFNQIAAKNDLQKIENGDKIRYVYLKVPNPIHENVMGWPSSNKYPKELSIEKYVDWETMWEKTFLKPITGITDAIGWKTEYVATIEDLFG